MKHTIRECNCDNEYCNICRGGLMSCTVCGGAEGTLPTDCPGVRMTQTEEDWVYHNEIDFRDKFGWVVPNPDFKY